MNRQLWVGYPTTLPDSWVEKVEEFKLSFVAASLALRVKNEGRVNWIEPGKVAIQYARELSRAGLVSILNEGWRVRFVATSLLKGM